MEMATNCISTRLLPLGQLNMVEARLEMNVEEGQGERLSSLSHMIVAKIELLSLCSVCPLSTNRFGR